MLGLDPEFDDIRASKIYSRCQQAVDATENRVDYN